jgi:hypothetical protein
MFAIFFAGAFVGALGSQFLEVLRPSANSRPQFEFATAMPEPLSREPNAHLERGDVDFLNDLRRQQGSPLAGSSLESAEAAGDKGDFAAALQQFRRGELAVPTENSR